MYEGTGHLFRELDKLEDKFTSINAKYKGKNPEGDSELYTMLVGEYESDTKRVIKWEYK